MWSPSGVSLISMGSHNLLRRVLTVAAGLILVTTLSIQSASAATLLANCNTRWKPPNQTEGLNWCASLQYNDTTGEIKAAFDFSDYATGNVYAIRVVDVNLWRNVDGVDSVKDSCGYCPDDVFVYDAAQQDSTGWNDYVCGRAYRATATFRIQWNASGDLNDPITRGTDWALLC